jgi:hypothetical protein
MGKCRTCKCLMLVDRFDNGRVCSHCDPGD